MRITAASLIIACTLAAWFSGCASGGGSESAAAESSSEAWSPQGLNLNESPAVEEPATVDQLEAGFAEDSGGHQAEPVSSPARTPQVEDRNAGANRNTPPAEVRVVEVTSTSQPAGESRSVSVSTSSSQPGPLVTAVTGDSSTTTRTAAPVETGPRTVVVDATQVSADSTTSQPQAVTPQSEPAAAAAPAEPARREQAAPSSASRRGGQAEASLPAPRQSQPANDGPDPFNRAAPKPTSAPVAVDAMIGQVNGRALYASRVLEPLDDGLAALAGQGLSPAAFRARAAELVRGRLVQIVADALILGEAERNLNEAQQSALRAHLSRYRASLMRQGLGSIELTEQMLQEKHGKSLNQMIEEERQKQVVRAYLQEKLFPKIYVSRKMVERYYQDNIDEFQPKPKRTLRLIRVIKEAEADRLGRLLQQGTSFEKVASDPANLYEPRKGGMWGEVTGDKPFRYDELNAAIGNLGPNQYSPRLEAGNAYWWLYADDVEVGESRSLQEAQLEIEQGMREGQFQRLTREYREELFETGSYNPLDEMTVRLVDIATSRYLDTSAE